MSDERDLLDRARLLRIGRNIMCQAVERGEIQFVRLGRRVLIPRAAIMRKLEGDVHA